jgi:hypothetical protein
MNHQSADGRHFSGRNPKARPAPRFLMGALLALLTGGMSADAALVLFTDRAAWRVAAGGGTGNFTDNLDAGTANRGALVLSFSPGVAFPNFNAQTTIDGTGYARFLLDDGADFGRFTFSAGATALGYEVNPQGPNAPQGYGATVLVAIDGVAQSSYQLPATETIEFVGFVSDTPFVTYEITTAGSAWHGVDNLEAFVVPEPSTYFAAGFLALAAGYHFVRTRRVRLAK